MYYSIIVIALLTGLYTIIVGLRAVVVTESIQTVVLVTGAIIITIAAWNKMGGWQPMTAELQENNSLDKLSAFIFHYPFLFSRYTLGDMPMILVKSREK